MAYFFLIQRNLIYNKDRIYFNIEDGFMSKLKDMISNEDVLNVLSFEVRNRLFNIYKK